MKTFTILLLITSVFFSSNLYSQSKEEVLAVRNTMIVHVEKHDFTLTKNNHNELQSFLSTLFIFYKVCISSQDSHHCSFTPSCSEYAMQSVKKQGLILGILNAFDRLSRCNGYNRNDYEEDEKTHLLIDPI